MCYERMVPDRSSQETGASTVTPVEHELKRLKKRLETSAAAGGENKRVVNEHGAERHAIMRKMYMLHGTRRPNERLSVMTQIEYS